MKDIVIKGSSVYRELWILAACYVIANIVNLIAIVSYNAPWMELLTMQGYVIVLSFFLYLVLGFIRSIYRFIFCKRKK